MIPPFHKMYCILWNGGLIMKGIERKLTKRLVTVIMTWLGSALVLLCVLSFSALKLKLRQDMLAPVSAAVIFVSTLLGACILIKGEKTKKRFWSALIFWAVVASTLLMLGFLAYGEAMRLYGLIRILTASLCGSVIGFIFTGKGKSRGGTKRFPGLRT